jgi:cation transport regulator ChaC
MKLQKLDNGDVLIKGGHNGKWQEEILVKNNLVHTFETVIGLIYDEKMYIDTYVYIGTESKQTDDDDLDGYEQQILVGQGCGQIHLSQDQSVSETRARLHNVSIDKKQQLELLTWLDQEYKRS